jgi:hypothetical protein
MGNCVYVYQEEVVIRALENYNMGHPLPTPTRQPFNAAIRFKDGIMGPICLYNTADMIGAIFAVALLEEEGKALSYCQASDLITFLICGGGLKVKSVI